MNKYDEWGNYLFSKLKQFNEIASNKNITINTIEKNNDYNWFLSDVSINPNITCDFIVDNFNEFSDQYIYNYIINNTFNINSCINMNPTITEEDIDKYSNIYNLSYCRLSYRKNISLNYILNHLDKPWDFNEVCKYKRDEITIDIILKHPELQWNFFYISLSKNITFDIVKKYRIFNFDRKIFSMNSNLNIDIVKNNKWNWYWYGISKNKNITWNDVINNSELPWDYDGLSCNKNITWEIVCNNPDKPWNYTELSKNESITWDIIYNNLDKKWNFFRFITHNPNVTIDSFLYIYNIYEKSNDGYHKLEELRKNLRFLSFDIDRNQFLEGTLN